MIRAGYIGLVEVEEEEIVWGIFYKNKQYSILDLSKLEILEVKETPKPEQRLVR